MTELAPPRSGQSGWHVADRGWWGWAETAVKLVAIVIAVAAAVDDGAVAIPDTHRVPFWLLTAVAIGYLTTARSR